MAKRLLVAPIALLFVLGLAGCASSTGSSVSIEQEWQLGQQMADFKNHRGTSGIDYERLGRGQDGTCTGNGQPERNPPEELPAPDIRVAAHSVIGCRSRTNGSRRA